MLEKITTGLSVEDILRDRISRHEIRPGTKLSEIPLAEEFGVGRSRVREALAALEQRGLVERVRNHGARVAVLRAEDVSDIYDVFELMEGLCVRLAVQKAPPGSWGDLVDAFGPDLEADVDAGGFDRLFDAIMTYRARTQEAAANPPMAAVLDEIYDRTRMIIRRTLILPGRAVQSLKEHREIVGAMQDGDAERAESLKRANMRTAREFLERYRSFVE